MEETSQILIGDEWRAIRDDTAREDIEGIKGGTRDFIGEEATISVKGTPEGNITKPSFTGIETSIAVKGTPSGEVSIDQNIDTVNQITDVGESPSFSFDVVDRQLVFAWDKGRTPSKEAVSLKTGIKSASFTGEEMTSSGTCIPEGEVSKPSFSGEEMTSTGQYIPKGRISQLEINGSTT